MENLYFKLPEVIQNIIVTIKNIEVYYSKYGIIPIFHSLNKVQKEVQKDTFKINDPSNIQKINSLVKYAKNHTEYYKYHRKKYYTIKEIDDFNHIPFLEKRTLRKNILDFYSDKINWFNHTKFKTSGTTGSPMKGFISKSDLRLRYKIVLKTMCEAGFDFNQPYARFIGKNLANKGEIYRKDYLNNHYFFSIFQLSPSTIHLYHSALIKNKIQFIEGYPSTINTLVNLLRIKNLTLKTIRGIFLTAEKLNIGQKENIESFFGCKVFDYYGSTEQSIYIFKSPKDGKYYPSNKTGYLEVYNSKGQLAKSGEEGEMIVTSFTSHFTPLIRYRIGDRCVISKVSYLKDGSFSYILDEIIGRNEDSFQTRDGRIVSRFSLVLKFLPPQINETQLYLSEKTNEVKVLYTTSNSNLPPSSFDEFQKKTSDFIGEGYKFIFTRVPSLKQEKSGKIKTVFIEKNEN